MVDKEEQRCEGYDVAGGWECRCRTVATIYRDDTWYCEKHDPVAVKAKEKAIQAYRSRVHACESACEGYDDPMELRRQRDEAVRLLQLINDEQSSLDFGHSYIDPVMDFLDWAVRGIR